MAKTNVTLLHREVCTFRDNLFILMRIPSLFFTPSSTRYNIIMFLHKTDTSVLFYDNLYPAGIRRQTTNEQTLQHVPRMFTYSTPRNSPTEVVEQSEQPHVRRLISDLTHLTLVRYLRLYLALFHSFWTKDALSKIQMAENRKLLNLTKIRCHTLYRTVHSPVFNSIAIGMLWLIRQQD
jgi:hypothetical protein